MFYLLKSYFTTFTNRNKVKVGFIAPSYSSYNRVMPSTRIRVYDIIDAFKNNHKYKLSIYNRINKFDIVIFQKIFDENNYQKALKLKEEGVKVILDINVNYYDNTSSEISNESYENIIKFTKLCDAIIVSSIYLKKYINNIFPRKKIFLIEENINKKYFEKEASVSFNELTFIWSGFSIKASELLVIEDVLIKLNKKYDFKLIIISEKNPNIKIGKIPIKYLNYEEQKIRDLLLKGNVFISPRNIEVPYNKGHSFTKIGVAMALGMTVVASPIASYLNSPALLCKTKQEWYNTLTEILSKKTNLDKKAKDGVEYCKQNYDISIIKSKYEQCFKDLL